MSTEIFLNYCQQKAWANEVGLVLVDYRRFRDDFGRFSCQDGCQWPVEPGCEKPCAANVERRNG